MKKRILATLMSAATIASTLAGCGGTSTSTPSTNSSSNSNASSSSSGEVQEIQWMFWDDLNATEDLISLGYK
ncbi:MAG: ABC transporter substrate-binding protein, partial [Oscillospiraceae bacterium]|nr:ABC transporter substrate-binding protein [Oscillospiraceae bacterium]